MKRKTTGWCIETTGWCIETTDCFLWLYQFFLFFVSVFKTDVLRTIIFLISSFCLFMKTNRGRFMLCLVSVFYFLQNSLYEWNLIGFCSNICLLSALILCSEFLYFFLLTKYQKFYALLKFVLCRNCFRFNQVQHKHQGFVFIK